mgnify:CR=1 FL=1
MTQTRRVLILTADAGLGHRSAAKAIAKALTQQHGDAIEVHITNPLQDEDVPSLLQEAQSDYDRVVRESPRLYRAGFEMVDTPAMASVMQRVIAAAVNDVVRDLRHTHAPHVIVSTYPSYQGLLDTQSLEAPYVVVITDLTTIHHAWFHPKIDLCIVPTEAGQRRALKAEVPAEHIEIIGIPVDPTLAESRDRRALRTELGWDPDATTLLAVGGKRVIGLEEVLQVLNHAGFPLQLALVAGNNDNLYRRLQETQWHQPTRVYGFVDNMPELLHASDAILCKAGGLIVSEALAAGLPLLLVNALPGQERGNAEFVIEGGAGVLLDGPMDVLETLTHWLADGERVLTNLSLRARELGTPEAAIEIAHRVWTLATRTTPGA